MAIPGREYTLNDCVKINTVKVFDVALWEMLDDPTHVPSVERLWHGFTEHLRKAVLCIAKGLDFHLEHQQETNPELLLSLLCHGTLEQGVDATNGGVEYYNMCVDGSGLAIVADSFAAMEQRIEREQVLNWTELAEHLRSDFAGTAGERVRLMLAHSEHYGQGDSLGDTWALRVSRLFTDSVKAHPTPGGRNMIPGWFSWSNTISMGKVVGATPNGRHAGEPISHGANPVPGFRKDGAPTAMARAIAAIQPGYGNTAPIQLEIDPGSIERRGRHRTHRQPHQDALRPGRARSLTSMSSTKRKFSTRTRTRASTPDLVVRVTGFTAFFATLSPEFRKLVVDRIIAE